MAMTHVFVAALAALMLPSAAADSRFHASPASAIDTKMAETVKALDTNGNGKVDVSELTAFAKSQGLSTEEVLTDFKELDVNHDGALDSAEIGPLFGAADGAASSVSPEVVATPAAALAVETPAVKALTKEASTSGVAAEKKVPRAKNTMGLDLAVLEHDAQEQAGGVIASRLAERAQVLLARSAADERKAESFDTAVRSLRGNATALAQQATQETREAARAASSSVSQKSIAKLTKLQAEERKAEVAADERREQAKQAMERVRKAQASLRSVF